MSTYGPTADSTYPTLVSPASSVLTGHRSVVNTALFHPTLPLLYTAGVERIIVQHGPASTSLVKCDPSYSHGDKEEEEVTARRSRGSGLGAGERRWRFVPREPKPHFAHPGLDGPSDPADDPEPLPGETPQARELRLRREDPQVLQYFDGLVEAEGEDMLWNDSDDTDDDDEDDDSDPEQNAAFLGQLRELLEGAGPLGSTRRVLNLIDQLDAAGQGHDVDGGESGSTEEEDEEGAGTAGSDRAVEELEGGNDAD